MPKPKQPIEIAADHREEASGLLAILARDPDIHLTIGALAHGDYQIAKGVVCERKSANDFAQSIVDKRLYTQLEAVQAAGLKCVFLLHGDMFRPARRLPEAAIIGAMSDIYTRFGVGMLHVDALPQAAIALKTLARHHQFGLGYELSTVAVKPKSLADQQVHVVASLPGVGLTRARALLGELGSVGAIMAASVERLCEIDGIGRGVAEQIHLLLHTPVDRARETVVLPATE